MKESVFLMSSPLLFRREVDDATAVMAIVMFLFIIPAKPKFCWSRNVEGGGVNIYTILEKFKAFMILDSEHIIRCMFTLKILKYIFFFF